MGAFASKFQTRRGSETGLFNESNGQLKRGRTQKVRNIGRRGTGVAHCLSLNSTDSQSALSKCLPEPVGAVDSAEVFEATNGLRRASCSRALSALNRSRNQVFSGHCQLASTSPLELVILSAIAIKVLQQGLYQGITCEIRAFR
jgi:hypothetical protein